MTMRTEIQELKDKLAELKAHEHGAPYEDCTCRLCETLRLLERAKQHLENRP